MVDNTGEMNPNPKGTETEKAEIPPKRQFLLRRRVLEVNACAAGCLEELLIEAHAVQFGDDGVIGFMTIVNDPFYGPRQMMQHIFREWYDVRELTLTPSLLVH
jgi:hypothetical protein